MYRGFNIIKTSRSKRSKVRDVENEGCLVPTAKSGMLDRGSRSDRQGTLVILRDLAIWDFT